jgi:hypothetical protein
MRDAADAVASKPQSPTENSQWMQSPMWHRYCSMLEFGLGHEGPRRFVRVVDRAKLDEEILALHKSKLAQVGQKEWKRSYARLNTQRRARRTGS